MLVETGYVLQRGQPDRIPEEFIPGAPDLAVEVLSPNGEDVVPGFAVPAAALFPAPG